MIPRNPVRGDLDFPGPLLEAASKAIVVASDGACRRAHRLAPYCGDRVRMAVETFIPRKPFRMAGKSQVGIFRQGSDRGALQKIEDRQRRRRLCSRSRR